MGCGCSMDIFNALNLLLAVATNPCGVMAKKELDDVGMGSERREGFHPVGQDTAAVSPARGGVSWAPPEEHLCCTVSAQFLFPAHSQWRCWLSFCGAEIRQETKIRLNGGETNPCPHPGWLSPRGGCGKLSVSTRVWKFWGNFNLAVGCEKLRGFTAWLCWALEVMGCKSPRRNIECQLEQGRVSVSPQDCDPLECPFPPSQAEGFAL